MASAETARVFGAERPSLRSGFVVAAASVAVATAAIYPLKAIAPAVSLSVVYMPAVLVVSAYWGLKLGLLTSLASATAFNFFHIPPVGRFTIADSRNWVALAAFTMIAAVVSTIAEIARGRTFEAERRRAEADLAAALARELLAGEQTQAALGATARRVSEALGIPSSAIELGAVAARERRLAIPLRGPGGDQIATLIVPQGLPRETMARLQVQVVPSLEALVAIALHRDAVQAEAVETAALRRSDELKTALLRAVSHDLRTPLTAMVTAGHALGSASLTDDDRAQLSATVVEEGERLSALIEKLFDLSRLQAGRAEPRREWISIEEVLLAARDGLHDRARRVRLSVDPGVPALLADARTARAGVREPARKRAALLQRAAGDGSRSTARFAGDRSRRRSGTRDRRGRAGADLRAVLSRPADRHARMDGIWSRPRDRQGVRGGKWGEHRG